MSIFRFLSLGILLFGTLAAVWLSPLKHIPSQQEYIVSDNPILPLVELSGFALIFTTSIFSQLFQHSVPGLMRPLRPNHKRAVPSIFGAALATTATLYVAIGCCCAFYFGDQTKQSINLNFIGFRWGIDPATTNQIWTSRLAAVGSLIVVVFPALDTLSVFPLVANTLGNNLYAAVPRTKKYMKRMKIFGTDKARIQVAAKIFWRLVASIPPIVGSSLITQLSLSLQLAGICGIVVALVTPALLHKAMMGHLNTAADLFAAKNIEAADFLLLTTPYSSRFSQPFWSSLVLLVALVALVICLSQMIFP
jgi:amino acid permease